MTETMVERLAMLERLHTALDLADTGVSMMRQNLRRAYPDATPAHIDQLLSEWLGNRPGAERGDCPGPCRSLRDR